MSRMTTSALCAAAIALLGVPAFAQTAPAPGSTPPAAKPPAAEMPAPTAPPAAGTMPAAPAAPAATGTPAVGTPAAPAAAEDCAAQFTALDANADGFISDTESPRDFARSRIDSVTPGEKGLTRDEFVALCGSESWTAVTPEEGAPFEGANSFTEEQARDRAVAWNVTDVSALVKDDKGVWRGTGKVSGAEVGVAVDYKGNVVTSPKP